MIDACPLSDQEVLRMLLERDPVVQRYRAFFALLDWHSLPQREETRPGPGPVPHPPAAYVKALLIKLCEHKEYLTKLRAFLVEHPLLVLEIGFRPVPAATALYGFDHERTVPCARWLGHWQQHLDTALLQGLLGQTGQDLRAEIPGLGVTVACDVKHIDAWVAQNNPKAYVTERYNPAHQPAGDPDCRLGVKMRSNQLQPDGTTKVHQESVWGYGSGVAAATDPRYGDAVLAEYTQPFNEGDSTYYPPLYGRAVIALGARPTNITADAAFDAWHIYQTAAPEGSAAILLNLRGRPAPQRHPDGTPLCPTGRP
jgi:hypothetical protein